MDILLWSFASFYILWVAYLAVMNLKKARDEGTLSKYAYYLGMPLLIFGYALDIGFNWIIGTVMFLDLPREATLSHRLERYAQGKDGWRKSMALWFADHLLDDYDPDGEHIDKD